MSDGTTRFIAGALIAVGAILVLLAGPCTLFFGGGALVELFSGGDASLAGFILAVSLIFGGLPTAAGIVLIVNGWRSLRR
jgi:hypothetical protein